VQRVERAQPWMGDVASDVLYGAVEWHQVEVADYHTSLRQGLATDSPGGSENFDTSQFTGDHWLLGAMFSHSSRAGVSSSRRTNFNSAEESR